MLSNAILPSGSYGSSGYLSHGTGAMTATISYSAVVDADSGSRSRDNSQNSLRLKLQPSSGASQLKFKYVSMDSDGFTINVTAAINFSVAFEAYP